MNLMAHEILSPAWIEAANALLSGHDTKTVREFSLLVELRVDEWKARKQFVGLQIKSGRLQFVTKADGPVDAWIDMPLKAVRPALLSGTGDAQVFNKLSAAGDLRPGGDFAKLIALQDGAIRGADKALIGRLAQLTL
jgi:hypothetical protein